MDGSLNMMSITVEQFTDEIEMQLEEGNYNPMFGLGKPGVGKTMSIAELCKKRGIGFCELRLVTLTEVDMLGIPVIENGRTTYASNALLPDEKRDGDEGILVLDEITSCSSTIRAAAYQLLDSKRSLGNYKLPKKWKVICLGNGSEDGGVFTGMESAFMSRCMCFRIEPDVDCWKKWALENGVNPAIPAFITFDRSAFHKMNPDEIASIFPCPRSWVALSTLLNAREKYRGRVLDEPEVLLLASGAIGMEVAPAFAVFYRFKENTSIDPEAVLKGQAVKSVGQIGDRKFKCTDDLSTAESQVMYLGIQSVAKALAEKLKKFSITASDASQKPCIEATVNVCKWILAIASYRKDYAITAAQDIARIKEFASIIISSELFDDMLPEWTDFSAENASVLFGGR